MEEFNQNIMKIKAGATEEFKKNILFNISLASRVNLTLLNKQLISCFFFFGENTYL